MAKQSLVKLPFNTIEETDLPDTSRKLYEAYRKAMAVMLKSRNAFEADAYNNMKEADTIPAGRDVAFGYNFGKLGVAFCDVGDPRGFATRSRASKAKPAQTAIKLFGK